MGGVAGCRAMSQSRQEVRRKTANRIVDEDPGTEMISPVRERLSEVLVNLRDRLRDFELIENVY